jgi:hypothetical protein
MRLGAALPAACFAKVSLAAICVQVDDGKLVFVEGVTSCHELRVALGNYPPHLPLVAFSSAPSLPVNVMEGILGYFRNPSCQLLASHQATLSAALADLEASGHTSRCGPATVPGWHTWQQCTPFFKLHWACKLTGSSSLQLCRVIFSMIYFVVQAAFQCSAPKCSSSCGGPCLSCSHA